MEAGWFWAVLLSIPAGIALVDGYREEAILGAAMSGLSIAGMLIAWPLGMGIAIASWVLLMRVVARRNARRDMEARHKAIMRLLKLRVGVTDAPARAAAPERLSRRSELS
jgi:hypothetical protein